MYYKALQKTCNFERRVTLITEFEDEVIYAFNSNGVLEEDSYSYVGVNSFCEVKGDVPITYTAPEEMASA